MLKTLDSGIKKKRLKSYSGHIYSTLIFTPICHVIQIHSFTTYRRNHRQNRMWELKMVLKIQTWERKCCTRGRAGFVEGLDDFNMKIVSAASVSGKISKADKQCQFTMWTCTCAFMQVFQEYFINISSEKVTSCLNNRPAIHMLLSICPSVCLSIMHV